VEAGGGRKLARETQAGILDTLGELVCAHAKDGPTTALLWTNKSLRKLEKGLSEKDCKASWRVLGETLKMSGRGLRADKKTLAAAESEYESGVTITDEEFDGLKVIDADSHGEWNYSVAVNS
jgi:hypothetical protein